MNGDHFIPAFFKAIIEECALRATEEDIEGIPDLERFRVISHETGLLMYILARAGRRKRIAELGGAGGSASTIAWLAGAASATEGEVTGWESNPRRMLKLQNCLCRSRLSPNVNLSSSDPVWEANPPGVAAPPATLDPEISNERFDCVVFSLSEWDWLKRLDLAWRILEPGGLLIITDTLNIDDESSQVLRDFLSTRSAAVAGFRTAEGMIAGFKPETESRDRILDDSDILGTQAAGILADLTDKKRTPGIRLLAVPPETGRLLWILARITDSRKILEIGSGGGYSGIWLSSALEMTDGHLMTIEIDPVKTRIAKASYRDSGLSNRIELIEGDAFDVLPSLHGPFDLVFLDSEKSDYVELLDLILPLLRNDGLLIADNVISHAEELKLYVDTVQHRDNLASVTAVIGSGEEITLKL